MGCRLSNNNTFNPPLFSLVNTFKESFGQNAGLSLQLLFAGFMSLYCCASWLLQLRKNNTEQNKEQTLQAPQNGYLISWPLNGQPREETGQDFEENKTKLSSDSLSFKKTARVPVYVGNSNWTLWDVR
jgi:hypothetical protein